ncbi:hypothetical protein KC19_1G185100, partial [Ceratodon purpureus]
MSLTWYSPLPHPCPSNPNQSLLQSTSWLSLITHTKQTLQSKMKLNTSMRDLPLLPCEMAVMKRLLAHLEA